MKLILSLLFFVCLSFNGIAQGDIYSAGNKTACTVLAIFSCASGEYEEVLLAPNSSYGGQCSGEMDYIKIDFPATVDTDFTWEILGGQAPLIPQPVNCNQSAVTFNWGSYMNDTQHSVGVF